MNPPLNLKTSTVTPLDLHAPSPEMEEKVEAVERIIKYEFKKKNKRLLEVALTHSSCVNAVSNLRLAFMGDAVLGLAVSKYLYHEYPGIDQGDLTRLRSVNVGNEKFARVAVRHNLYNYLRRTAPDVDDLVREFTEVVNGEDQEKAHVYRGSMDAPKVLADIVESVAAAIYVDLNYDLKKFWKKFRHLLEPITTLEEIQEQPQPVTELYEFCQKHGMDVIITPQRDETKRIENVYVVYVDGEFVASGSSKKKGIAKVNAAKIALRELKQLMCINDASVEVTATATTNASGTVTARRKPVFIKVEQIQPGTSGHTLMVKVVNSNPIKVTSKNGNRSSLSSRPFQAPRIAECLVGDETGVIVFTARNDQVETMKPGTTVILRNAKIDMFKGTMRLAVDKWGRVEVIEPADFEVLESYNLSLVEYELVDVGESDQKSYFDED
ncbi:hypothetical protein M0R45_015332 [Rubus argutus]|uniref:Uncharacterized protein n=1 Tax=Rubus argutus TaxID=59490 RepID=A0AAW1XPU1_RUBAR